MGTDCSFNENKATTIHLPLRVYKDNILRNVTFTNSDIVCNDEYHEQGFSHNELPKTNDLYLNGYYQSEKYFNHRRDNILELFKPRDSDTEYIKNKYGDLTNTCSIHVRRGDYLIKQQYHPVCDLEYYTEAITKLPKDTKFLVFSDDISWCKSNFIGESFTFIENELDYIDLHIMSMCNHNIIANSTFSWWGAWLNNSVGKVVITPKQWFGSAKALDTTDIIPENWITI